MVRQNGDGIAPSPRPPIGRSSGGLSSAGTLGRASSSAPPGAARARSASPAPPGEREVRAHSASDALRSAVGTGDRQASAGDCVPGKSLVSTRAPLAQSSAVVASSKKWTLEEVRRLWQLLDRDNSGSLRVSDLVKSATVLQRQCPELLLNFDQVAGKGQLVRFEDCRRFLLGEGTTSKGRSSALTRSSRSSGKQEAIREVPESELVSVWQRLDPTNFGKVGIQQIVENRDFLKTSLPQLVSCFEEVDSDGDFVVSFHDLKVFFGGTKAWLENELAGIVGLDGLKEQIRRFHRSMVLDEKRRSEGHSVSSASTYHMIFQGNPGTGKTSMARIMAKLLMKIGIIECDRVVEVQRTDLVAEHVGQTGPKTQKVIEEAAGGVLFVDEAYRLSSGGPNDFGREATDQLMAAMNTLPPKAPVQIYAGYINDMAVWMRQNEGIYRRISYTFTFSDYTCLELAEILEVYVQKQGFALSPELSGVDGRQKLASLLEQHTLPQSRALMNGGLCERIFASAKQALDDRDDPSQPSVTLQGVDIVAACSRIPAPPKRPTSAVQCQPVVAENSKLSVATDSMTKAPVPSGPVVEGTCFSGRNLVLRLASADHLRDARRSCLSASMSPYVEVAIDGVQVYKTFHHPRGHTNPIWNDTLILPIATEAHQIEFTVRSHWKNKAGRFISSCSRALSSIPSNGFSGELELTHAGKKAGLLEVQMAWQMVLNPESVASILNLRYKDKLSDDKLADPIRLT